MDLTDTSARSILDLAAAVERDERRIKLALLSLARAGDGPLVLEYPRDLVRNTAETAEKRHVSQTPVRGFAGPRRAAVLRIGRVLRILARPIEALTTKRGAR